MPHQTTPESAQQAEQGWAKLPSWEDIILGSDAFFEAGSVFEIAEFWELPDGEARAGQAASSSEFSPLATQRSQANQDLQECLAAPPLPSQHHAIINHAKAKKDSVTPQKGNKKKNKKQGTPNSEEKQQKHISDKALVAVAPAEEKQKKTSSEKTAVAVAVAPAKPCPKPRCSPKMDRKNVHSREYHRALKEATSRGVDSESAKKLARTQAHIAVQKAFL